MTLPADSRTADASLVALQISRPPRDPWTVAVRCAFGFPAVLASPSTLADGTPFPTHLWLTCPHVADAASAAESGGATAEWSTRLAADPALAARVLAADARLRAMRADASCGADACATVGVAGQADPLATKCLHAHAALALAGLGDPIGEELLARCSPSCGDERCAHMLEEPK